ncbi:MAG: FmdB family zinc ribbon protein [Candidatus Acidiferrales bacterium]
MPLSRRAKCLSLLARGKIPRLRLRRSFRVPLYAYKCAKCRHEYEKIEKLDAPPRQKCPQCKGRAERQLTAPAVQFKGSGWYVTDYARKSAPAEKKEAREAGDSKEGKEAKEAKDGKETKEAKPTKDKKVAQDK